MNSRRMPLLHVFIVIPVPERPEMLSRTYETLAPLGQHEHLSGQSDMVDLEYKRQSTVSLDERGAMIQTSRDIPEVVQDAKKIDKHSLLELEEEYGIKVCTAMLSASGISDKGWDYREIYIHSKLLLIDDTFFTIGSANINLRSMAVDSEMNVGVLDPALATDLRKRVWSQLSGGNVTGDHGTSDEIESAFEKWSEQMIDNQAQKLKNRRIKGFLLPLNDTRSSIVRLS